MKQLIRFLMLMLISLLSVTSANAAMLCPQVIEPSKTQFSDSKLRDQFKSVFNESLKTPEKIQNQYKNGVIGFGKRKLGEDLFRRYEIGESTPLTLMQLGYSIKEAKFAPPELMADLYANITKAILQRAKSQGLSENDIILPVVLFSNAKSANDTVAIRLGIDDLPDASKGWELKKSETEVSSDNFTEFIADGKMIFEPHMLFHDVNHFVDFIQNPAYMKEYRDFSRQKLRWKKQATEEQKTLLANRIDRMENNFNEFVYLPDPKAKSLLLQIFPNKNIPMERSAYVEFYKKQKPDDLMWIVEELLPNEEKFYRRHGGGARDESDRMFIDQDFQHLSPIFDYCTGQVLSNDRKSYAKNSTYLYEELPLLFDRLKFVLKFINNPDGQNHNRIGNYQLNLKNWHKLDLTIPQVAQGIRAALPHILAEIEITLKSAMDLKLTEQQLVRDTALLMEPNGIEKYQQSVTYKHYQRISRPDTAKWNLWVAPF